MWAKCEVVIKPMIGAAVTWPIARKRQRAGMRVLKPAIEKARDIELLSNYLPPIFLRLGYLPDGTISTRCTDDTVSALRLSDALGRPNLPSLRLGGPHSNSFIKAVFIFIPTIIVLGLLGLLIFHVAS
jgi:hypothetical protein